MIVEVKKSHLISTLLDPTEPLAWAGYCSVSDYKDAELLGKLPYNFSGDCLITTTKKNCQACAVGTVIRNLFDGKLNVSQLGHIAHHARAGSGQWYGTEQDALYNVHPTKRGGGWMGALEAIFEGSQYQPGMQTKSGRASLKLRKKLAKFVKDHFPKWVPVDVDGADAELLKKSKAIRIQGRS